MEIFFMAVGIICLVAALYGAYSSYSVFIGPLLGKWPLFNNFYVVRGVVVSSNTITENGSTSTVSSGTFGGLDVRTTNYSIDHDILNIRKADGSVESIRGEFISHRVAVGDEVVVAGVYGQRETLFRNLSQKSDYTSKIIGATQLAGKMIVWSIPFIGELFLVIYILGNFTKRMEGVVSERAIPNETKNIAFACLYHVIAVALGMMAYFNDRNDVGGVFQTYWLVTLSFTVVHMILWRKDTIRFHGFLKGKVAKAAQA